VLFAIFYAIVAAYCGMKAFEDFKRGHYVFAAWGALGVLLPLIMMGWLFLLIYANPGI